MYQSEQNLPQTSESLLNSTYKQKSCEKPLTCVEKLFLLHVERGDCANVRKLIGDCNCGTEDININCVDPLNRSAFIIAIENGNIEMVKLLLESKIEVRDGLLHAINEEFVEAVELLLDWEERNHQPGDFYSWEKVDRSSSTFTSDITPLILASHKNNYEIIKLLLDRGATLPVPHDVKCGCVECVCSNQTDSLRHLQARINAYKALTSPSLISLSSTDPLLTSFELSWDLRRLSRLETEFRTEYNEMRRKIEKFAAMLLDHVKTSEELMVLLNYDNRNSSWISGERQTLERLKLAIKYKQKNFVAHPSVQQLLGTIWYEGVPGFRRKNLFGQIIQLVKLSTMFPFYCVIHMVAPDSRIGLFVKKPFVKFICHSTSYLFFLMLLGAASQRLEIFLLEWIGGEWMSQILEKWQREERGKSLGFAEWGVVIFVTSKIWKEIRKLYSVGLIEYISDLWNVVDIITNIFYVVWLALRICSMYITWSAAGNGANPFYPREEWHSFEPMLISEGAFAAGMISSFLKLVHIFSVNPHLGPLQISLGRMIIDIVKFFFVYTLVLFAFACGLNQLLWYYARLEKNKCYYLPSGNPDFENNDRACTIWRRYANLFETSQSLFWASFGLVDLMSFELTGIKSFTRFWALLMFGCYSVINIIVLLNMLIAMMSNSFQTIAERADVEWKFARSKLWMSFFEDEDILPPPFNILPTLEVFWKVFAKRLRSSNRKISDESRLRCKEKHETLVRVLMKRFITSEQRKRHEFGITEDDVIEIRQDISMLRYELIDILGKNGMHTPEVSFDEAQVVGRKGKMIERRILKDFQIGVTNATSESGKMTTSWQKLSKSLKRKSTLRRKRKDWNLLVRQNAHLSDPIGSSKKIENVNS